MEHFQTGCVRLYIQHSLGNPMLNCFWYAESPPRGEETPKHSVFDVRLPCVKRTHRYTERLKRIGNTHNALRNTHYAYMEMG